MVAQGIVEKRCQRAEGISAELVEQNSLAAAVGAAECFADWEPPVGLVIVGRAAHLADILN